MPDVEFYDSYRHSSFRYLGYAHIVGGALSELWPRYVTLSYGITWAYILADTFQKCNREHHKLGSTKKTVAIKAGDVLAWQMLASVIIPGFAVNRIGEGTRSAVNRFKIPNAKYLPTVIALASIPFIIRPIDRLVDFVMDKTYRKIMRYEK